MEYNFHPIFVHFPIALLTLYAIFEIARFRLITRQSWYLYVKASFLIIGSFFSLLAVKTGQMAEDQFGSGSSLRSVIEAHEEWASASAWIFGILAVVYLIVFIDRSALGIRLAAGNAGKLWKYVLLGARKIYNTPWLLIAGALAGIIAITVAGALGGAIVYGPEVDPLVKFIYPLLVD